MYLGCTPIYSLTELPYIGCVFNKYLAADVLIKLWLCFQVCFGRASSYSITAFPLTLWVKLLKVSFLCFRWHFGRAFSDNSSDIWSEVLVICTLAVFPVTFWLRFQRQHFGCWASNDRVGEQWRRTKKKYSRILRNLTDKIKGTLAWDFYLWIFSAKVPDLLPGTYPKLFAI